MQMYHIFRHFVKNKWMWTVDSVYHFKAFTIVLKQISGRYTVHDVITVFFPMAPSLIQTLKH